MSLRGNLVGWLLVIAGVVLAVLSWAAPESPVDDPGAVAETVSGYFSWGLIGGVVIAGAGLLLIALARRRA